MIDLYGLTTTEKTMNENKLNKMENKISKNFTFVKSIKVELWYSNSGCRLLSKHWAVIHNKNRSRNRF